MSGEPFHRCTHTALSPQGDIYVSDGYGNARVHKYSPDGKLLLSWGEPGTDPGQFNIAHNICCDADGWVYVADRENHRVQVFDGNGKYETQWNNLHRPVRPLHAARGTVPDLLYRRARAGAWRSTATCPNLGPRVSIVDNTGQAAGAARRHACRASAPTSSSRRTGWPSTSRGDIYVGEVSWTQLAADVRGPAPATTCARCTSSGRCDLPSTIRDHWPASLVALFGTVCRSCESGKPVHSRGCPTRLDLRFAGINDSSTPEMTN